MKRKHNLLLLMLLAALLSACGHAHEWNAATCESPKTCAGCGETEGEALGHSWEEATCEIPKTCSVCNAQEGEALGHAWEAATCEAAKTCSACGTSEGDPLEHDVLITALYSRSYDGTCKLCGQTVSEAITEAELEEMAKTAVLGKWYAVLRKIDNQHYKIEYKDDNEWHAQFHEDGTARFVMASYDKTGTWEFYKILYTEKGDAIPVYFMHLGNERYTFSIQAFSQEDLDKYAGGTMEPGLNLISHPDGTDMPFAYFSRKDPRT